MCPGLLEATARCSPRRTGYVFSSSRGGAEEPATYGLSLMQKFFLQTYVFTDGQAAFPTAVSRWSKMWFSRHSISNAVQQLIQRHSIFRTFYDLRSMTQSLWPPTQHVVKELERELLCFVRVKDKCEAKVMAEVFAREPFGLSQQSALRILIIEMEDDTNEEKMLFVMRAAHVASDGFTLMLLDKQLTSSLTTGSAHGPEDEARYDMLSIPCK